MIDLTEHFIVKQKSVLKHQKLLLKDVTLRAWVLKKSLNRQGPVNQKEALTPPLDRETASLPLTRVLRVLSSNRL